MVLSEVPCPKCGKTGLYVEKPSDNEVWVKCHECDLFLGMSDEDWHRIHNSPNLHEKIAKVYKTEYPKAVSGGSCRACKSGKDDLIFGICKSCLYKILIVILVIMVIGSYAVWMSVL
ncbi:hypothetical protein [Methanoplanus limicola]|uniref:Uncharacterized protein n=1 Tax=Methanoplanus limicola DSM 2279 TaxID=937775 RepID=H1YZM8_9EURY|nr:hypothetical protein [Methanoplanus limicola]EHQ37081.1 hypothetical protein Metlim_3049 [Methanoplanus limicola DSM 2279]